MASLYGHDRDRRRSISGHLKALNMATVNLEYQSTHFMIQRVYPKDTAQIAVPITHVQEANFFSYSPTLELFRVD